MYMYCKYHTASRLVLRVFRDRIVGNRHPLLRHGHVRDPVVRRHGHIAIADLAGIQPPLFPRFPMAVSGCTLRFSGSPRRWAAPMPPDGRLPLRHCVPLFRQLPGCRPFFSRIVDHIVAVVNDRSLKISQLLKIPDLMDNLVHGAVHLPCNLPDIRTLRRSSSLRYVSRSPRWRPCL